MRPANGTLLSEFTRFKLEFWMSKNSSKILSLMIAPTWWYLGVPRFLSQYYYEHLSSVGVCLIGYVKPTCVILRYNSSWHLKLCSLVVFSQFPKQITLHFFFICMWIGAHSRITDGKFTRTISKLPFPVLITGKCRALDPSDCTRYTEKKYCFVNTKLNLFPVQNGTWQTTVA